MPYFGKRNKPKTFMQYEQKQIELDGVPTIPQIKSATPIVNNDGKCPCCGHQSKVYHRRINANMGLAALVLYSLGGDKFVHLENTMIAKGYKRSGDASYLTLYGILQRMEGKRVDSSPKNGMYRLTAFGRLFCESKATVNEKFIYSNNKLIGFEGKQVGIKDILKEKFDYSILISESN